MSDVDEWRWMMTNEWRWGMSWLVLLNDDEWQVMWDVWRLFHANSYVSAMRCICCVGDLYEMYVMPEHTEKSLHTGTFTQKRVYTKTRLHTGTFTQKSVYTQELLHRILLTFAYTQELLPWRALTHTEAFTQKTIYTQELLHRQAFTPRHV